MRRQGRDVLAGKRDASAEAGRDADQRIDEGRLADAVASEQRERPAVLESETEALDDPRLAVAGAQVFDAQELSHARPRRDRPRARARPRRSPPARPRSRAFPPPAPKCGWRN